MNVLFISISSIPNMSGHSISLDLLHEFKKHNHKVYVICSLERKENIDTYLSEEDGYHVLRVKIGNNKKANIIEKGLTTVLLPHLYIKAIKKYFSEVKFDLVLYPTPPITQYATVEYIKKRDNAKTYLLLKDIFPQNAVDMGMMKKTGLSGIVYKYFRRQEKKLYAISDRIGCMSQANVDYVIKNNPQVCREKVEICPNCISIQEVSLTNEKRFAMREKYGIPQEKKVFVYGGNLGKPQGIPFLIECLKSQEDNEEVFFLIVGDGTEYQKLKTYFNDKKPCNMKLLERLPKNDYDQMIAACDVGMIFLDHRFTIPNFPSRLLSYLQAKLPVLACTDTNTDMGEIIQKGGFGWWCESNYVDNFKQSVSLIMRSDLSVMANAGYEYLNTHYTVQRGYDTISRFMAGENK